MYLYATHEPARRTTKISKIRRPTQRSPRPSHVSGLFRDEKRNRDSRWNISSILNGADGGVELSRRAYSRRRATLVPVRIAVCPAAAGGGVISRRLRDERRNVITDAHPPRRAIRRNAHGRN